MQRPIHIVWFKRDLRVVDHAPLVAACKSGQVLPLFCWEPSVWAGEDYAKQHQVFVQECLIELAIDLKRVGLNLLVSTFGIVQTLQHIRSHTPIAQLYSHEETGNGATYTVDKAVASWCKTNGVDWQETPQNGVVRRLKNRNHWNWHWEQRMNSAQAVLPSHIVAAPVSVLLSINLPPTQMVQTSGLDKPHRQKGGRN